MLKHSGVRIKARVSQFRDLCKAPVFRRVLCPLEILELDHI